MGDPAKLSRDDWEALLHAPFCVYSAVASADEGATEAQFRRLRDELIAGVGAFPAGTVGEAMTEAVAANLDVLWAAHRASGRRPADGVKRAVKALRGVPEAEAVAIRDWLLTVGVRVAEADRIVGEAAVSAGESEAIRELAQWLRHPMPEIEPG